MATQDGSNVGGAVTNGAAGEKTWRRRVLRFLFPVPKLGPPVTPALLQREHERLEARQNRVADAITSFSGSMLFVYGT